MVSVIRLLCRLLLVLMLTIAFFANVSAEKMDDYCDKCKNTGKIECKIHGADWVKPPYTSSAIIEHECGCCGIGWTVCAKKTCPKREEAQKLFDSETAPLKAWLNARRAAVEGVAFADKPKLKDIKALHVETKHFYLSGTFRKRVIEYLYKGMIKKKTLSPAESIHLYAERIEDIYSRYLKMLKYEGDYYPKFTDKWKLMVWDKDAQQEAASFKFCGFTNTAGAKVDAVLYTTWDSDDDVYLHHKLAHAITNLITDDYGGVQEYFPDWFREATAHWIEYDIFTELRIFTAGEGGFDANCPTRKLKSTIRKEVKSGSKRIKPLTEIINKKIMDISGWERLKCWSVVDWMATGRDDKCVEKLLLDFKQNYPANKQQGPSFRRVFDMTPDEIDEVWAAWVLETYPPEEDD
ncbi:MAG: hypothetical protein Kow00107_08830 [Planctomycetota bacterium]